ncbi:MAG: glucose 1-dehydrogenase [Alphaproteobacteria bacterium]|nr:glucose 1-dehydrogenase [Alphaproteobacteria bacterium]
MRLKGKVALVTGAGGGFGEGIAETYAREGAKVCVADIRKAEAERVAKRIGGGAIAVACDVAKKADVDAMVAACAKELGGLDIVVNNAGTTHKNQSLLALDEAAFDRLYAVNVKSIYLMTLATVPALQARGGGSIINVGSTAGLRPRPGLTWYNGTKGAVNLLSKSMAVELAPMKIRVNCICPVIGETGLLEMFMGVPDTPENRARFIATIPLGRMSKPQDIANAALWLASDEASFITGVELPVDGGRCV